MLPSDGGIVGLRDVEKRRVLAACLAACIDDPRAQGQEGHNLGDVIRFRLMMIASGYEDGNDASGLRYDPAFKQAQGRSRPVVISPRSRPSPV